MVIDLETRRLRRADFCACELNNFQNLLQAWTYHPLHEVLDIARCPMFLEPMFGAVHPGDRIEVYQVPTRQDLETPERDFLAMARIVVTGFYQVGDVRRMTYGHTRPILKFGPNPGPGVTAGRWGDRNCVWKDGDRVGMWSTMIAAEEQADELRGAA